MNDTRRRRPTQPCAHPDAVAHVRPFNVPPAISPTVEIDERLTAGREPRGGTLADSRRSGIKSGVGLRGYDTLGYRCGGRTRGGHGGHPPQCPTTTTQTTRTNHRRE